MKGLALKNALITGASSGIGQAITSFTQRLRNSASY